MHKLWPLAFLCALSACSSEDPEPSDENRLLSDQVLSIAHGGAQIVVPPQTLLSYQKAAEANADVLEVDLHSSSDGVLVVIHDDSVDRTTDGTGRVHDKTFAELGQLDAGYRYTKDGGASYPFRGQGLTIPAFDDLLTAFPDAYWVVEIKQREPSIVAPLVEMLAAHGASRRVVVASFHDEVVTEVRQTAPLLFTSLATGEMAVFLFLTPDQEATWSSPARFVQPPFGMANQERVDRAHRLDMKIQPWTVNDPETMQSLIDLGVDGIITDDPATLEGLLAEP